MPPNAQSAPFDFIRETVAADVAAGRYGGKVVTRFPPEPNGYLHIGHAKALGIDFGVAADFGGRCHLRMDDTNPAREEAEYVEAIKEDVRWLGWDWGEHLYFASDYFGKMIEHAERLIEDGRAYVDDLTADQIREHRGTLTAPGRESPWRNRSVAENRELFRRMRAGEFPDGSRVLRARIDMAHPNLNMRDPVMYRILHMPHHRSGDAWCVYPSYDWAHGLEDSIEGVTHSLCDLDFENHRPLYDWFLDQLGVHHPRQIEFARLNISYTVLSKRRLMRLIEEGRVTGWDDPRLPTLRGLRRRGYTPASIRRFCAEIGITKTNSLTDVALLEHGLREELNLTAPRAMAVLDPVRLVIENYPADREEELDAVNNPEDPAAGTRKVPFCRELYIEREDFREDPPKKFFRLAPGREVRLRYAYLVTCTGVVKDPATGAVRELRCTYDPATRGGDAPDGRKVKSTLHWVSARHAWAAPVRLYDRLFTVERPDETATDFMDALNPASLEERVAQAEPGLRGAAPGARFQFERKGYFVADHADSAPGAPVFNRIVPLRDTWARIERAGQAD
ncbi:MAG: glutamine--tRNA ligase/YqeY domain fusion protein [Lentisphaerae bacterium]|nr:glutamine--tRNA ligase/YqeY domain fusion protein [Lentisphaerota bacterium]